tara:strand:- start:4082 stop:5227 length:1146 start_codon:yes stop_codon:yes gene_type:complete
MKEFNFENKNIIILLKAFSLGGAEKQALFLANYLQKNYNCTVNIYSYIKPKNPKLFFKECELLQLKNLHFVQNPLSAAGNFNYIKRRIKILLLGLKLRKYKPDIIIPYLNPPSIIANLLLKTTGAKITFWHHRGPDYYRGDSIESLAVKKTKLFIANSPDGKKELESKFSIDKRKSYFLPNFSTIKTKNHKKGISKLDSIKGKKIIGMIGHFRQEKLQSIVVKSFYKLLKNHKDIHLVLAGNIDESEKEKSTYSEVINFIKKHQLSDKVTLLHNVTANEVLPYFDFGVLMSKKEGMPNVIMEYMSYNLPVICTNHEGCKSLLGDKYPYLINNSVDELTEKIEFLLQNETEFNSIGQKNKNRIEKNFSIEKYIENLTTIINS